ncbi:acyltransferase [uncultured Acinetobacter sp.]|uniref:acyltransferase family protein n=1 Tax=uncultured Acinetobacter sp. TaxID=165433 RepID=UPI002626B5F8|nr:acyltransferase [uncultured Acinetobacter sp.]
MSKINSAESIRGLACFAVIISHLILTFFPGLHYLNPEDEHLPNYEFFTTVFNSPFTFFYAGSAAVYIFFVLSGFVLSYAILKSGKDINRKIASMTIKRYPRLAVPALVSCLLVWAAFHLNIDTSSATHWISRMGSADGSMLYAIYDALINAFIFGKSEYNWVLWTMQSELLGSVVIFALLYIKTNFKNLVFFISSIVFLIGSFGLSTQLGFGVFCFLFGMFTYLYGFKVNNHIAILMLIIGLYFAGAHNESASYFIFNKFLGNYTHSLLSVASGPLVVYSILMNSKLSGILDTKPLVFLGKLSFSLYLLHMLMIYIVGMPIFNYMNSIGFAYMSSTIAASVAVIITSLISSIFYSEYIDDLSINIGKKIEKIILK